MLSPLRLFGEAWRHVHLRVRGKHPIYLDYPPPTSARYGWGLPPHRELAALLSGHVDRYESLLGEVRQGADELREIPVERKNATDPFWLNGFVQDLDAAMLHALPRVLGSKRYLEIGSGNSTKFVARARRDYSLDLRIVSIDPSPRADIDDVCDEIHRAALQDVPLELFDQLEEGDVLAIDGSHRCLQNSDVTVVFLEILPRLKPGVVVYVDDVFLPSDYPPEWEERHYSEQYVLAVLLLADRGARYEVLFPGAFSYADPHLRSVTDRFWRDLAVPGLPRKAPNGFWMRVRDTSGSTDAPGRGVG